MTKPSELVISSDYSNEKTVSEVVASIVLSGAYTIGSSVSSPFAISSTPSVPNAVVRIQYTGVDVYIPGIAVDLSTVASVSGWMTVHINNGQGSLRVYFNANTTYSSAMTITAYVEQNVSPWG